MEIESILYGEKPEIVLLHEGLGSVSTWGDFLSNLHGATGRGVFAFSRHGYGKSAPKPAPIKALWGANYMHEEAARLGRYLDRIGFEDGYLIGHSDGASISSLYMGQTQDPRVKGLILIAPHFFVEEIALLEIAAAKIAYETTNLREKLARHHVHVDDVFWGWNGAWLSDAFRNWNIETFLPKIPCKTLLIQGREDQYGTLAQLECAKQTLTVPFQEVIIENCKHNPAKEQQASLLAAIKIFLEQF